MNRKMKLRYRAVLSLMLSAALFCMPAAAFSMNGGNAIDARAEDSVESGAEAEETENTTEENSAEETADQETSEPGTTEKETESGTEEDVPGGTVSGNEIGRAHV